MKKYFIAISVATLMLLGCAEAPTEQSISNNASQAEFSGGDGSSIQNAVIIDGPRDLSATQAEHTWLREHVTRYKLSEQRLIQDRGHIYDEFIVVLPDGKKRSYFFDISHTIVRP